MRGHTRIDIRLLARPPEPLDLATLLHQALLERARPRLEEIDHAAGVLDAFLVLPSSGARVIDRRGSPPALHRRRSNTNPDEDRAQQQEGEPLIVGEQRYPEAHHADAVGQQRGAEPHHILVDAAAPLPMRVLHPRGDLAPRCLQLLEQIVAVTLQPRQPVGRGPERDLQLAGPFGPEPRDLLAQRAARRIAPGLRITFEQWPQLLGELEVVRRSGSESRAVSTHETLQLRPRLRPVAGAQYRTVKEPEDDQPRRFVAFLLAGEVPRKSVEQVAHLLGAPGDRGVTRHQFLLHQSRDRPGQPQATTLQAAEDRHRHRRRQQPGDLSEPLGTQHETHSLLGRKTQPRHCEHRGCLRLIAAVDRRRHFVHGTNTMAQQLEHRARQALADLVAGLRLGAAARVEREQLHALGLAHRRDLDREESHRLGIPGHRFELGRQCPFPHKNQRVVEVRAHLVESRKEHVRQPARNPRRQHIEVVEHERHQLKLRPHETAFLHPAVVELMEQRVEQRPRRRVIEPVTDTGQSCRRPTHQPATDRQFRRKRAQPRRLVHPGRQIGLHHRHRPTRADQSAKCLLHKPALAATRCAGDRHNARR